MRATLFFSGVVSSHTEVNELFIDRDYTHFRYILNWLRGVRCLPEDEEILHELVYEADYFCMLDLKEAIVRTKKRYSLARSLHTISNEMRQSTK